MSVEETNERQESALSKLRANIEAQREEKQINTEDNTIHLLLKKPLELVNVPLVIIEGVTEFNLERYEQLCDQTNALYHNYLFSRENIDPKIGETLDQFEQSIKTFVTTFDGVINEGCKIRWS